MAVLFLPGFLLMLFPLGSCERLEFEPDDLLFITTDSIRFVDEEDYELNGSVLNLGKEKILEHGFAWSEAGSPNTFGTVTRLGPRESIGDFSSTITGLELKTTYFVRAYAETESGTTYGNETYFRSRPRTVDPIITDYDGNTYHTVIIGQQAWMVENLRTTHYADGTPVPLVETDSAWEALSVNDAAYCWYDNDISNAAYGAYYTWEAAMRGAESSNKNPSDVQGVCPEGWHIPSDAEWNQFHMALGMYPSSADNIGFLGTRQRVGTKMKGIGDPLWEEDLDNPRLNESGFTALPVGQRSNSGISLNTGKYAYFWSSTEYDQNQAWYRYLQRGHSAVLRVYTAKDFGFSVRCVVDL